VRILYVIQELHHGGAEKILLGVARAARAAGHSVAAAAAPGPLAAELPGERYDLPLVKRRPSRVPSAARAVRQAMRHFGADLVHAHNPVMAAATGLATLRGRTRPALATVHGVPAENYRQAAWMLRMAGLPVVACGPGVATALADCGLRVHRTIVNSVSPPPAPADRAALIREWGFRDGRRLVLAVGRLVPEKNHRLAIRALAALPDASLVIVGHGPLREALEREADAAGVRERVVFTGIRTDARALIGAADAIVLPSQSEGLPLVALEALAAGTPLVATSIRGVRELIGDGESALLVPAGDAEALADALRRVLEDDALAHRLRVNGLALAAEYSEQAMTARYLDLYEQVVAR
jgi:glycosyltransferase involved in cell wall biosynthesis